MKRLSTNSILETYDDLVNLGYTKNFKLLKSVLKLRMAEKNEPENFSFDKNFSLFDLVNKKCAELNHIDALNERARYFASIVPIVDGSSQAVYNSYVEERASFWKHFILFYGNEKKFSDVFSGFEIFDEQFIVDMNDFESGKMQGEKRKDFETLMKAFLVYLEDTKLTMNFLALSELLNKLIGDFTDDGYLSIGYGKENKDIALITKAEIDELRESVNANYLELDRVQRPQAELVKKLTAKAKRNPQDKELNEELKRQTEILQDMAKDTNSLRIYERTVEIFEKRFDYANEYWQYEFVPRTMGKIKRAFRNTFSRKVQKLNDAVYYHKCEATILEFDMRALGVQSELPKTLLERVGGRESLDFMTMPEEVIQAESEEIKKKIESGELVVVSVEDFDAQALNPDEIQSQNGE